MSLQPYAPAAALTLLLAVVASGCGESSQEPTVVASEVVTTLAENASLAGGTGGGITVSATGASEDGRTFRGTLTITGADFDPQIGPVLLVGLHGALTPASPDAEATPTESVPLTFGPIELSYKEMKTDEDCIQLEMQPPAEFDPETKTSIQFDVSKLTMAMLPGPASLLADLICANDRAVAVGWSVEGSGPVE